MSGTNNVILALPEAGNSVDYTLKAGAEARLSFSADDISDVRMDGNSLVITFANGGEINIQDFNSLVDAGTQLTLSDGSALDPAMIDNGFAPLADAGNDNHMSIDVPADGVIREITLEPGQDYYFNFALQSPIDASAQADGSYIFSFANNAKIVLSNYAEAMGWDKKPELITDTDVCALTNEELITTIEQLVMAPQGEEVIEEEPQSETAQTDAQDVADVEPAAGEEGVEGESEEIAEEVIDELAALAEALAEVTPAAGDDAGGSTGNSGYGYNSQATPVPLGSINAVGPLGRTALGYVAPKFSPELAMDVDDIPVFNGIPDEVLDESDFNGGPLIATGTVVVNYGADSPGAILPNGIVNAVGSVANNNLTSGGHDVELYQDSTGYYGEANGQLVFTFAIDPYTGQYTYTQHLPFDHADSDDPDDVITLQIGIAAVDADGDTVNSMVVIRLADDAPVAHEVFGNVDETDIGPAIATGTMDYDFRADDNGTLSTNGGFSAGGSLLGGALTSNGVAVTVTQTATGYIGMAGTTAVFTLHVNLATGEYTYTQLAAIDHNDATDANDVITLSFGMDVTDFDGDTVGTEITISVADDGPVTQNVSGSVDETDAAPVATGTMNYDYGSDAAGHLSTNGAFSSSGSQLGGVLSHNGVAVVVTQTANGYVGTAGGVTVFTLNVDLNTGAYTYTQLESLDHANANDPNDVITLAFGMDVTDADGDTAYSEIIINVTDDGPVAVGEDLAAIEDQVLTGNVMANDDLSNDGTNVVTQVAFNGGFFAVPTGGSVTIIGNYGTLIMNSDGAYTYTAAHWNPDGTDTFTYTIRDFDGDTSSADMAILVSPIDDIPVLVQPETQTIDESDLGVIQVTGAVEADFFTDGPGTYHADGTFAAGGSLPGGALTHDGQPITVALVGREYIGTAGGVTIFSLQMNELGEYTFTLYENLDHADGNDDNDIITLEFGVYAKDFDGDTDAGTITIEVKDDAATAASVFNTTDETNLDGGPITVGGTLTHDFGADGEGSILPGGSAVATANGNPLSLTSGGVAVIITQTANGYVGTAGGATVFTITMNADTGAYSFTQNGPLDHPNTGDHDDALNLTFGFTVTDGDGDSVDANVVITVRDDGPAAVNDTNLLEDTAHSVTGNLLGNDDAGSDGVGRVTQVSFGGTPHSVPAGGSVTVTGLHGTWVVNSNGSYTYTITDPDAPATTEVLSYVMNDKDGDTSSASLTINIENRDEVPVLVDPTIRTVDETDLGTAATHLTGQLQGDFHDDGFGSFAGNGGFASNGSQMNGVLTSGGVAVAVTFNAANGTYTGKAGSETIFTLKINADGTYVFDLTGTLDHADPNDPNDIINLDFGVRGTDADGDFDDAVLRVRVKDDVPTLGDSAGDVDETALVHGNVVYSDSMDIDMGGDIGSITPTGGFTTSVTSLTSHGAAVVVTQTANGYVGKVGTTTIFTLTVNPTTGKYTYTQMEPLDHPNASNHNDTFNLNFGMQVTTVDGDSDTATITITVADDGVDARNDINGAEEDQYITGNVLSNDYLSQDELNTVTQVTFGGTTHNVPAGGSVTINATYGTFIINSNGTYSYQATAEDPNGTETFTYRLRDGDGDNDTATLSIRVTPDGEPVAVSKAFDVDETNLTPGPMIFNGNMNVDFGRDGMGTTGGVTANGTFSAGASLAGGSLKSNGVAVAVTQTATGYVGMAGSKQVFTLTINKDGTYRFQLLDTLDHANATDPNDVITLTFGVTIADRDGDTAAGSIRINVHDDAPVAYDESRAYEENAPAITGNVTSNDNGSEDLINTVTRIVVNGQAYNVPATGNLVVQGTYGQLTINSAGAYSYHTTVNDPNGVDRFTYTLRDGDGDTDTAVLSVTVTPDASPIVASGVKVTDETGLNSGAIVETGNIGVNWGGDTPSAVTGNGGFSASGSLDNGALRHMGAAVSVSYSNGVYTGTAAGKTIFTLTIASNGSYVYRQFEQLDHANNGDHNDVINLNFGILARDSDGDTGNGTLTVQVRDDGPIARNDSGSTTFFGSASTGNVRANDTIGADNGANDRVIQVSYAGQTVNVAASGWTTINETVTETRWFLFWSWQETVTYSTLQINANGDFRLTSNRDATKSFTYVIRDDEGDTSAATATSRFVNPPPPPPSGDGGGSPLVLDLDGDGIELTTTQGGVTFDVGPDGVMDQVAWVSSDDALLGIDLNGDGLINDHNELFGRIDQDGFNVLANYNSNGDAKIDAGDEAWEQLLAWRDLNQDGIAQENEMFTMDELGIASISLAAQATDYYLNGSWIPYSSTFTYEDGTTHQIVDAWFKYLSLESWMQVVNTIGYDAAVAWLDAAYEGATTTNPMEMAEFNADGPLVVGLTEKVYEDALGTDDSLISDQVNVFYGDDQPGEVSGTGKFQASGSMADGELTVGGVPVEVTFDAATGIYSGTANGEIVFALRVGGDGTYDFKLFQDLDHREGNNFDNFITLEFGIQASDGDGDTNESSIRLQVINEGSAFEGLGLDEGVQGGDLYGVEGTADMFFFQAIKESADTLHDFNRLEGDSLDISALLEGQDGVTEAINDFVHSREENGSTVISVDADGLGAGEAVDIVRIDGVTGLDVQEMLNDGNLVV